MWRDIRAIAVLLAMVIAVGATGDAGMAVADQLRARRRKPPVSVEVTNFPESSSTAADEYFNVRVVSDGHPGPKLVTRVPADRVLVLTDIDGRYGCGLCDVCQLVDLSGVRLDWLGQSGNHRSYTTGLKFGPGQTVWWSGPCVGFYDQPLTGAITLMGKLIASPSGAFLDE